MRLFILVILFGIFTCADALAQTIDSVDTDVKSKKRTGEGHSVKVATLLSLIPGAGQIYNRKYWKVPIIYAGFGAVAYFVDLNNKSYQLYQDEFAGRILNDTSCVNPALCIYGESDIKELRDYYRKFLDVSIISGIGLYVLNIIDANVDAHLFYFDVSDDLSLKISPAPIRAGNTEYLGVKLALKFR